MKHRNGLLESGLLIIITVKHVHGFIKNYIADQKHCVKSETNKKSFAKDKVKDNVIHENCFIKNYIADVDCCGLISNTMLITLDNISSRTATH